MTRIAVIGLGSMGFGMARQVLGAGHVTHGFDINPDAESRFRAEGGAAGALPEIAQTLDIVGLVVLNAEQTETVLFGPDGIVGQMRKGAVIVASATVAPDFAREMALRCDEAGVLYLDAPVSGGVVGASSGTLSVMAAGPAEAFEAARPYLDAVAKRVFDLGAEPGAGSAMKAVNQLLAGVNLAVMTEAITFGMTQGVSPEKFMEIIPQCAGTSWMLEDRVPQIVNGDYTAKSMINIWPKDLGIVMDIARSAGFSAPITAATLQQFLAAAGIGLGHEDDAALAKLYARNVGLTLPGEG